MRARPRECPLDPTWCPSVGTEGVHYEIEEVELVVPATDELRIGLDWLTDNGFGDAADALKREFPGNYPG